MVWGRDVRLGGRSPGSSLESSPNEWLIARIESGACQLDVEVLDCLENNEVGSQAWLRRRLFLSLKQNWQKENGNGY